MTINTEDLLNSIIASLDRVDYVKPEDIPNIDLYMDQVTTFMEEQFKAMKRYPDDKILTKTMINNYAKNNLLPPPVRKKYTKEHIFVLIFIFYFKNILSIKDIDTLLNPLTEKYFGKRCEPELQDIYNEICEMQTARISQTQEDIKTIYEISESEFKDVESADGDYLRLLAFICSLSVDVYLKKTLVEKLIDELPEPDRKKRK